MTRKIIAVILQLIMFFSLIYSTIIHDSVILLYLFFPLFIIFSECFEKINLKRSIAIVVCIFFMLELAYAVFLGWKKADYYSSLFLSVYSLIISLMCIIINVIKWLLKKKRDGSLNDHEHSGRY